MTEEQQFWAVLTHKRDEGLAHITGIIERSGTDEFCGFLTKHVLPRAESNNLVEAVIGHMAIVGAVDALLAWKERGESDPSQ